MNVILTDSQVSRLEGLTEQLQGQPARITRSIASFDYVLNNSEMATWIQGTAAAQSVATELRKDIETLQNVANLMNEIINENKNIVTWNRRNNSETVR